MCDISMIDMNDMIDMNRYERCNYLFFFIKIYMRLIEIFLGLSKNLWNLNKINFLSLKFHAIN